ILDKFGILDKLEILDKFDLLSQIYQILKMGETVFVSDSQIPINYLLKSYFIKNLIEMERIYDSSSSPSNYKPYEKDSKLASINQAEEFMKDFSKLTNLDGFKQLIEDFEKELTEDILIKALELLSDISFFKYHSKETMIRLEVHLRTWMVTLERLCYLPVVLGREIREQLYSRLSDFIKFHHNMTNVFKQGVNDGFKSKSKSKEISVNNEDLYVHFQNYNINFLLIHLRDTLHSMRDDEIRTDEVLRRTRDLFLTVIQISPKVADTALGNVSSAFGFNEIFRNLSKVFNFKYSITYWYTTWRELLSIHYLLENLTKDNDYSKLRFYNEIYLLELLWQCIFTLSIDQADQKEILDNQNKILEFLNFWTKKEPIALPNSLWFGCLDIAQRLSQKTEQLVSLALCYYLGLESLQKSKCNYICFKSLELLLSLSYKKPELFEDIISDDISKYKESLSIISQNNFETIAHDVTQKLQLNTQLMEQSSFMDIKEKSKINSDKLILDIIADELTCPITKQITGDFSILSCGHSFSSYAINKWKEIAAIENRLFECPLCKNEIELKSIYNLPKIKILEGLYDKLEQAGYLDKLSEERQKTSNEIHIIEDDLFLKFNKYKIFQTPFLSKLSLPIFQNIQPKSTIPAFMKAAKAEQQGDHAEVIIWLTQVLHQQFVSNNFVAVTYDSLAMLGKEKNRN
ncbi:15777_t:CDS:2, partial [Gigaspora margarita]